jgi:ATP-dependent DNA helicase DinG
VLTKETQTTIQTAYRAFLNARDLKARYAQKHMIAAVARQLGGILSDDSGQRLGENHLVAVEAGTGTGKTIAYLLAALPIAQAKGKTLIISTATVALQEQLLLKDLPELAEHAGIEFKYEIAKGRRRYLCVSRLEALLSNQQDLSQTALFEDEMAQVIGPDQIKEYSTLLDEFARGRWKGDRDDLERNLDDDTWMPLTSDHMQCTNRRCAHFNACPFYRARADIETTDLLVVNHDLVLADLALGGGAILPNPADSIYIFDEAHHLGDKATNHFALSMRVKGSEKAFKTLERQLKGLLDEADSALVLQDPISRIQSSLNVVQGHLQRLDDLVSEQFLPLPVDERRLRYPQGRVPDTLAILTRELSQFLAQVDPQLEKIINALKGAMEDEESALDKGVGERWLPPLSTQFSRVQKMMWLCRSFSQDIENEEDKVARWLLRHESEAGRDIELHSAPVSAQHHLQDLLWGQCYGAVLTSATLTALGRFDSLFTQLGLPLDTPALRMPSPFDYANKAVLHVPKMQFDPSKADLHTEEIADWLNRELPKLSSVLVLFTSWRQMRRVEELIDTKLLSRLTVQGELSKQAMLVEHKARIDRDEPSVIFGLASFAEGVDLPGHYLKDVIITKLPFSVPDDPVDATLAEWIEARGGNPFMEISVPAASIKLTQAAGRLLRTENDSGRVVLLDRRVVTRRYGQQLIDALPPFARHFE